MTEAERRRRLARAMDELQWTKAALARELACSRVLVVYWLDPDRSEQIPDQALTWLETLAAYHQAHPAPQTWRIHAAYA